MLVKIFSQEASEGEQEARQEKFREMVEVEARALIAPTNLHKEKKTMIPVSAGGVAFYLSIRGQFDLGDVQEAVNRKAETIRANILKPDEGDYRFHAQAIIAAAKKWNERHSE